MGNSVDVGQLPAMKRGHCIRIYWTLVSIAPCGMDQHRRTPCRTLLDIPFQLPPTSVCATLDVEPLSAYLARVRKVQDSVGDIVYVRHLSQRLQRAKKLLRIVLVHG